MDGSRVSAVRPDDGTPLRVLIVGGYGTFGGRLAQLLADEPRVTLIIAGRSGDRAVDFIRALSAKASVEPARFDRDGDLRQQLRRLAPHVVVDASGPFQGYGDDPYRLPRAAVRYGAHYIDLADASAFVAGIGALDAEARAKGVFVLAGASSLPVLTAAVTRRLAQRMESVEEIMGGIAPSPYAGVGGNVIRAVASYGGKRVPLRRNGAAAHGYGLFDVRTATIAPPGAVPLGWRLFSLVDVPDLTVLPQLWPDVRDVWMGAAPVPEILHRALNVCAGLVRFRAVWSLSPLAPLMERAVNTLRWGEHRGGMIVRVAGRDERGERVVRSWHLLAEGDDGPLIPSMASEAIVRKLIDGAAPTPGARSAACDLELSDYEALFARRAIVAGVREDTVEADESRPLYRRLLGAAWDRLPAPIQAMHDLPPGTGEVVAAEGRARVERGRSLLARLMAGVVGFPQAGEDVPVRVEFTAAKGMETWRRTFAGGSFASVQRPGAGRAEGLLTERFGPLAFDLALVVEDERLKLVVRRWRAFGAPMPAFLAPRGDSYEHAADGRFNFHVEIRHPLAGLVVRYSGWLAPTAVAAQDRTDEPAVAGERPAELASPAYGDAGRPGNRTVPWSHGA